MVDGSTGVPKVSGMETVSARKEQVAGKSKARASGGSS